MFLRHLLTTSRVGQLGLKDVPVVRADQTVAAAAREMRSHSHGSALVCQGRQLTGIFTERDLLKLLAAGKSVETPVAEAMTAAPRTVKVDDSLMVVIQLLDEGGYRRLPVIDAAGQPVGIVDVKSVVHFLVEHFPKAVYNQAPRVLSRAKDREGA
ncbi:MAG: CBS domain-containing protein [Planctomycetes bacterium]|nr:CBS domain-containing protein [Planctomycetota bacterium]